MADEVQPAKVKVATYTREELASSKKYKANRDVIMCILAADKNYTEDEAKTEIDKFLKKPIQEQSNERK